MLQDALHSSARHFARDFAIRFPQIESTFPRVVFPKQIKATLFLQRQT